MTGGHRPGVGSSAAGAFALAVCAIVGTALAARADVDAAGLWRVGLFATQTAFTFTDTCAIIVSQTDDTLLLSGNCQGIANPVTIHASIDPVSGVFSGSGHAGACGPVTVSGTVAADSISFTGAFDCPQLGVSGGINASRCGNGQLDAGETCDDGNRANGDCCNDRCLMVADRTACTDDGNPCTTDICNAVGQCLHAIRTGTCNDGDACTFGDACFNGQCTGMPRGEGSECDDGNACTTGDRCVAGACVAAPVECPACMACSGAVGCVPAIANACKQAPAHGLTLRRLGTDTVSWRWERGDSTDAAELGDPPSGTDYDFCIYDGSGDGEGFPALVLAAQAPGGPDWHPIRNGFAYDKSDLAPDGLRRALLGAGPRGRSRVRVKGLGEALALPPLQTLAYPLTVQLRARDGAPATCWSARYERPTVASASVMRAGVVPHPRDTRPNILVISLDDTRADGIDRMPTVLSRLAGEGVSFNNSFVPNPLCAPSRASLLTGLHSQHHGVRALNSNIGGARPFREGGADRQTMGAWLQGAGYMTGLFGKYVNGYGFADQEPILGPGGSFYVPPGWSRWRGMTSPEHFGGLNGGTYTLIDERGVPTVYDDHSSDAQYSTDVLGAQVREFISDAVQDGRPFLAVWTPYASHGETPSLRPEGAARHQDFFRTLAPWRPLSFGELDISDKPSFMQRLTNPLVNIIFTDLIRSAAYESLLAVDEQVRLILDRLVELGIDDDTVIIFTSDNGTSWGEHRLYNQVKECVYEECLRVPLVVRDPRRGTAAAVRDAAVLNIDIAPTVAELAGVTPGGQPDGQSFAAWLGDTPPAAWRSDFLIEHFRANRGDTLDYSRQPTDGDQVRFLSGDSQVHPRPSLLFEFDDDGAVSAGAQAVPIGSDEDVTFAALGAAVAARFPLASFTTFPGRNRIDFRFDSTDQSNLYLLVERDQAGSFVHQSAGGDWVGVRDVAAGMTYAEHETEDVELYDLPVDPLQLENKSGVAAYAAVRAALAQRLTELRR